MVVAPIVEQPYGFVQTIIPVRVVDLLHPVVTEKVPTVAMEVPMAMEVPEEEMQPLAGQISLVGAGVLFPMEPEVIT